jgi:hypothetical protein
MNRYQDWLDQAQRDLGRAGIDIQYESGSVQIISIDRDGLLARLSAIAGRICVGHPKCGLCACLAPSPVEIRLARAMWMC